MAVAKKSPAQLAEVADAALRALDLGDVAIFDWNLATGAFNSRGPWERLLGRLPDSESDRVQWFLNLVHPPDRERVAAVAAAAEENESVDFTFRISRVDGGVRWVHARGGVAPSVGTSERHLSGVMLDVTDHMTELHNSEALFRTMAESSPFLVWLAGPDMGCNYANGEFLRFAGRTMEKMLGPQWAELVHPDEREAAYGIWARAFGERSNFSFEAHFRRSDGEYRLIMASGKPIADESGVFGGYVGTCVDLTDIRRAEEATEMQRGALAKVLRIATMDQMAAGLAHELHQPLAAISAATGAALREISRGNATSERTTEMIDEARQQALRAGTLLGQMRDVIRQVPDSSRIVGVNEVVATVVDLMRREAKRLRIRLEVDLADDLPTTTGDSIQLQQVLINLVYNGFSAIAEADEGERVLQIRTGIADTGSLSLAVSDRGPGLSDEVAAHMFDVFFTTREDGLGMGLAISHSIIDAHGGVLTGRNRSGGGATFRILLPIRGAGGIGT